MRAWIALLVLAAAPAGAEPLKEPGKVPLDVRSSAFAANEMIPDELTCDGADRAPPLSWSRAPAQTRSIAVLVEDPDAPAGTFAHWIVTELPATTTSLTGDQSIPHGAVQGRNDAGRLGWKGPCPPSGTHHYVFHVFALDKHLGKAPMTRAQLLGAIDGHIVAQGTLIGRYARGGEG